MLTVHWQGACHPVESLDCRVPCQSHLRKRQPHVVLKGKATSLTVTDKRGLLE